MSGIAAGLLAYGYDLGEQGTGASPCAVDHLTMDHQMLVWDADLRRALSVLGITPTQPKPRWLLCAACG